MGNNPGDASEATARPRESQLMFVHDSNRQELKSHTMREVWKRRQMKRDKMIAPSHLRPLLPHVISQDRDSGHDAVTDDKQSKAPGVVEGLQPLSGDVPGDAELDPESQPPCPAQTDTLGQSLLNPWDIGWNLDPFDSFPVHLTASQERIFHHWWDIHAILRLAAWPIADCIDDVWVPLILSNVSAFSTMLAFSAAHLSSLDATRESVEVMMFKAEAVKTINLWLDDPLQALGDKTFLAILNIITFERRWGSEDEWNVHHRGLQRMLLLRGGLNTFDGNKPLKHLLSLILLLARPSWYGCSDSLAGVIAHPLWPILEPGWWEVADVNIPRDLWLYTIAQEISTLNVLKGGNSYTALPAVVLLLYRSAQEPRMSTNFVYVNCLVALSSIICDVGVRQGGYRAMAPSHTDSKDLLALDQFLESERHMWHDSIAGLHASLFGSCDIGIFLPRSCWIGMEEIFSSHWNANTRIQFVRLLLTNINRVMEL